jgi:glycerol-1-phosphate dehydrogenase [NAD(P)+]
MSTHVITLTKKIVIGEKVLESLKEHMPRSLLKSSGKVLVVTGPNVWRSYGDKLMSPLHKCGLEVEEFLAENSHIDTAKQAIDAAERIKATAIVGFGGGKSIDVAKYTASSLQKPFISIPTAPSHDGIASPFASIKGLGKPVSIRAVEPTLLIADMEIISSSPRRLIIAGAGDTIAKFTAVLDWRLAHYLKNEYYGEYAASLALLSAKHIVKYKDVIAKGTMEGIRIILEALVSSSVAMEIAGSTRPASGSEHLFSHALDMLLEKPALHGEQTAVGTIMMAKLHRLNWKKIRQVLVDIGAPVNAKQLGIPEEKIIEALTIAHRIRPERYTILGETGLTWEAAEKLARETMVIS